MDTLIDLNRLRADLDAKRQAFGVSWNTFAGFAGVSPAMFSRLNAGSTIALDTFARLCATCGLDPADYMPGLDAEDINDVIDMAKNRSMTTIRPKEPDMAGRLEYHGTRFTLDDLRENMRAKYRNERPRFYYDTPDGTPLGYVMTLPDGGYIARLEDTQAWHAGPYDSESDAFENPFRMISRYHSVDDPPAHARGIEGPVRRAEGSLKALRNAGHGDGRKTRLVCVAGTRRGTADHGSRGHARTPIRRQPARHYQHERHRKPGGNHGPRPCGGPDRHRQRHRLHRGGRHGSERAYASKPHAPRRRRNDESGTSRRYAAR